MRKFCVQCRVFARGAGEPNKAYTLYSNSIEAWDEVDASWVFLDMLLDILDYNVNIIDISVIEVA